MDMQQSILLGRIASVPVCDKTPNGRPMLTFDAVYHRKIKGPMGARTRPCFAAVVAYESFAEALHDMDRAIGLVGKHILIEGHLDKRLERMADGSDRNVTELVIDRYQVMPTASQIPQNPSPLDRGNPVSLTTSEQVGRVGRSATSPLGA